MGGDIIVFKRTERGISRNWQALRGTRKKDVGNLGLAQLRLELIAKTNASKITKKVLKELLPVKKSVRNLEILLESC